MRAWVQGNTPARFRMYRGNKEGGIDKKEKQDTLALNYEIITKAWLKRIMKQNDQRGQFKEQ